MPKKKQGFAAIDPAYQRELAKRGGAAVRPEDRGFSRNPELAREAARKSAAVKKAKREAEAKANG